MIGNPMGLAGKTDNGTLFPASILRANRML